MGRGCTMDEWVHFEKLPEEGRVPNSSYWYVLCRHCVRSYEHKQLVNPPSKLTGRRSAMRAHLKVCPVYAAQYKLEQGLASAAAATAASVGVAQSTVAVSSTTSTTPMAEVDTAGIEDKNQVVLDDVAAAPVSTDSTSRNEVRRRKGDGNGDMARGGRGKHCMMEEWEHFIRLQDDGYIGKSNFFYAICKHCQKAYDEAPEEKKLMLVPERMVGRREKMRKHLSLCPFFKGVLPPLERRGINSRNPATAAALQVVSASGTPTGIGGGVASAAAAGVVHSDVAVSSRLALDEWQYFTRLHRKPDSAYYYARCNFCQDAHVNAPPALQASMTPTIVMGRKSNMQTHLAKCPHVPKDIIVSSATSTDSDIHSGEIRFRDDYAGFKAAKRQKLASLTDETAVDADQADLASLYNALVEFTIQHELPFEWIESPSARKLFIATSMTSELASILPTAEDLRGPVLNELLTSVLATELARWKDPIPLDTPSTSDILDAPVTAAPWPFIMQVSVAPSENAEALHPTLECTLINGKMRIPVRYLPHALQNTNESASTSVAHYHGLEVARWVEEQLDQCATQEKIVPSIVMFPFSPVYERAAGILLSRRPNIVCMHNFDDLLLFCLLKMLQSVEVQALVSSLVELWGVDTIREYVAVSDPFQDWRSYSRFMQVLLDEKAALELKSAELKELIDDRIDWELLERVAELFRSFENAFDSFQGGHFELADILIHLQSLFGAARGFGSVLRALETVWWQLEQPLIVLTYALHPHLRLRNMSSTKLTKLSVLSDLSVKYFEIFFGHKASSLRGEVTAYLHSSQPVFARTFVSEFPVVEDYFRYLSDDFSSLSMLMRMLHAFSVAKTTSTFTKSTTEASKTSAQGYSSEEQKKMTFIKEYRKITQRPGKTEDVKPSSAASIDLIDATSVLEGWMKSLQAQVSKDWIDFASLEQRFELDDVTADNDVQTSTTELDALEPKLDPLPAQDMDDIVTYPSALLRGERAKKARLRDLFKPAEATI